MISISFPAGLRPHPGPDARWSHRQQLSDDRPLLPNGTRSPARSRRLALARALSRSRR
jgi:hypothetical protein